MTNSSRLKKFWPALAILLLLLNAGTLLAEERWLLIFDTSASMKKRLPLLDSEVGKLLRASTGEHIHAGDSVGVWAFGNNQLHAGQLPLITYDPAEAGAIATNVLTYVNQQHYTGTTVFDPLQSALGNVVQNSERLTVIIFCDGEGDIEGTPYDYAINQSMMDAVAGQKKLKQPVVVILRTQHGKFIGGTVNLPPSPSSVPAFPPLPVPPKPAVVAVAAVPPPAAPKAPVGLQALIINGTAISTNPDVMPAYAPKTAGQMTNPSLMSYYPTAVASPPTSAAPANPVTSAPPTAPTPPAVAPIQSAQSNPSTPSTPATSPSIATPAANGVAPSNEAPAPAVNDGLDLSTKILLVVGGIFFGMALLLVIFFLTRSKKPQASLITSLMTEDPNRRK